MPAREGQAWHWGPGEPGKPSDGEAEGTTWAQSKTHAPTATMDHVPATDHVHSCRPCPFFPASPGSEISADLWGQEQNGLAVVVLPRPRDAVLPEVGVAGPRPQEPALRLRK